ncbi:MAG: hypothetical protein NE330_10600 [Lentisphaeraceae bacterium]|nr:hypothetical protein [Lentisphaeraceae bacterium]
MENQLRKQHMLTFAKLSPAERLQWSLSTAWSTFNSLPPEKQEIYLQMRSREKQQRKS